VDDIVVKSVQGSDLLTNLAETFENLRQYDMKLNLEKCVFRVPVKVNLEKINAIINMSKLKELRDVQKLTRCPTALSRFISRLSDTSRKQGFRHSRIGALVLVAL
jgi:hypothetical protein